MATMATEKQREHIRNYEAKRRSEGWAKFTGWLSPDALKALAPLIKQHGSRDAAINAAILAYGSTPEKTPAEPKPKRSATVPAPNPTKTASEPEKRQGVDVPYAGDIKRQPMQKSGKGTKR